MPGVSSSDELDLAVARFAVRDLDVAVEPSALAAARRSLDESGLLLLGEIPGVAENPLVVRSLLHLLELTSVALEWPAYPDLRLANDPRFWAGDGRITAGHLAVLPGLTVIGFEPMTGARASWSQRAEAMAERILTASPPGQRTLVVAGREQTATMPLRLDVPLGAHLARERPGVQEIRIRYGPGRFYSGTSRPARRRHFPRVRRLRLHQPRGSLAFDLPAPTEATVPHSSA
jgi:hypothetical protein